MADCSQALPAYPSPARTDDRAANWQKATPKRKNFSKDDTLCDTHICFDLLSDKLQPLHERLGWPDAQRADTTQWVIFLQMLSMDEICSQLGKGGSVYSRPDQAAKRHIWGHPAKNICTLCGNPSQPASSKLCHGSEPAHGKDHRLSIDYL